MKNVRLILLFLSAINSSCLFSQYYIRKVDLTGVSKNINIDSIITISKESYDSIVISQLSVPQNLECDGLEGSLIISFITFNNNLIETKVVKAFEPKIDSILFQQNKIIYTILNKYSIFEKDKYYFITIGVRFEHINDDDNIIVKKLDSLNGRYYILQKSDTNFKFNIDTIPFNQIPKNIDECIIQLDSALTNSTKNRIKVWDKECFTSITSNEFLNWIRRNWHIMCDGLTLNKYEKVGLEKYFYDLGITEPCYIVSIIRNCYYRHLNGSNINFNDEVTNYIEKQKLN